MVRLKVRLNGTKVNPFEQFGLRCNPFPQVGKAELMQLERRIAELGGEPIKDEQDLRKRLVGFTSEFIEGCVLRFQPGAMTEFEIEFPD